ADHDRHTGPAGGRGDRERRGRPRRPPQAGRAREGHDDSRDRPPRGAACRPGPPSPHRRERSARTSVSTMLSRIEVVSGKENDQLPLSTRMSPGSRPRNGTFAPTMPPSPRTPPAAPRTTPTILSNRPKSAIVRGLLEAELERTVRAAVAEVPIRGWRRAAAARRPHDEPDLEQIGLDQLGQRLSVVVDRRGDRLEPHRAAAVVLDD